MKILAFGSFILKIVKDNLETKTEEISMEQKATKHSLANGVYAATLTPMYEDFSCNCEALVNHCNDLINRGCKGIVLFGTTGEGTSFSVAEREQLIKEVVRSGIDPQKIIIGITCCAINDAIKLASLAIDSHCAAVLISPPFFYSNLCEEGVINFYKEIIRSIDHHELKILLYHIPQYSGVPITMNMIKALNDEFPNTVIGIKESEGNLDFTKKVLSTFENFKVFVGHELHISEAVQSGAAGGISGIVNAYPELISSLYEYGKNQDKPDYNPVAKIVVQSLKKHPIFPAIKAVVESQKGKDWHVVRLPLVSLNKQQKQELIESLKFLNDPLQSERP
jgi:4-hydroxy-tetrahydrodipicolinate synthase